jgi:hypothetical protein
MMLWADANLPPLKNRWAYDNSRSFAGKSDIARYNRSSQRLFNQKPKLVINSSLKLRHLAAFFALARNGKARQAKRFSFLTTQLARSRAAVRACTGLPSIPLILLNRGRNSLRNLAKLVTIRH